MSDAAHPPMEVVAPAHPAAPPADESPLESQRRLAYRLSPQKRAFAEAYTVSLDADEASDTLSIPARRGRNWLNDINVMLYIEALLRARGERTGVTADMTIRELAVIAFSSIDNYVIDEDGHVEPDPDAHPLAMRALQSVKRRVRYDEDGNRTIETELRLWPKTDALRMLLDHLGIARPDTGDKGTTINNYNQQTLIFGDKVIKF